MQREPSRYAHSVGYTDVCYSLDGDKIITCGSDGDVRIWSDMEDADPVQTCVGEWALCVRQKNDRLYVATDNNNVQLITFPEGQRDEIFTRFTAHVNHIALRNEHNLVAVVSEDMDVRVLDVGDRAVNYSFAGLTGPPLSVAICPEGKILAVSCGDGRLRIWNVEDQTLLKDLAVVPKVNSYMNAKALCRMDFNPCPTKCQLAYPHESSVVVLNTFDWSEKMKLSCDLASATFSIVQYSPCGNFLAASTVNGEIVVWNVSLESVVGITEHPTKVSVCSMAWNPTGNGSIVFCDVQGQLAEVINCSNAESEAPNMATVDDILDDIEDFQECRNSDDEDDENVISLEKLKRDVMGPSDQESDRDSMPPSEGPVTTIPEVPMQIAFMPTSTPMHLNPRYLCWNDVGVVRCFLSDDESDGFSSIEVEFHDATFHNSMMVANYHGYYMGSLSGGALAVANASRLSVIPLNSGTKEWMADVSEDETIIGIASSTKMVAFVTSNYLVRVCSLSGIQKGIFAIPGPLVTLAAHENSLLIAYHSAGPRNFDQCISMMLVRFSGFKMHNENIGTALGPETTLLYVGFSDVGTPAMQNSLGMLYLFPSRYNVWVPFCDTSKHQGPLSDGFFVTAVDEKLQSVRGVRCRGSIYPAFTPRPVHSELPLEPPFTEMATEKTQLEVNLFAWSCLKVDGVERKYSETALKTFALACKNNLDQRAFDLVELVADPQVLNLAIKYAMKMKNRRLVEKLTSIAPNILEKDVESDRGTVNESCSTPERSSSFMGNLKSSFKLKPLNVKESIQALTKEELRALISEDRATTSSEPSEPELDKTINTQESLFNEEKPSPFSKRLKQSKGDSNPNPLDMADKFAGFEYQAKKAKKDTKINGSAQKRKLTDRDGNTEKDKQRKLDRFVFSK